MPSMKVDHSNDFTSSDPLEEVRIDTGDRFVYIVKKLLLHTTYICISIYIHFR